MSMRCTYLLALLAVASIAFAQEAALKSSIPDAAQKAAIPDDAAQKAASTLIADVYQPDYEAAKTVSQKIELAKKMIGEGIATKDDIVGRFVLFRISRDIAAQQGDLATAFDAIGHIGTDFDADTLQMKVDSATIAAKSPKTMKAHQACAGLLAPIIDEAIEADRYSLAKSLSALTLGCAREARDSDRIKQMVAKLKEVDEIAVEFEKVKEAKVALDEKPSDPAANYAVGRFLCLVKGDWKRGVTMLALSENEECKAAALLELEAQPDSLKVGDAWWRVAEGLEATAKSRAQAHAGEWYRKALPGLSGLTKARVERLVGQTQPLVPQEATVRKPPKDAVSYAGHHYKVFFKDKVSWSDAKAMCEELGGKLARAETVDEQAFLAKLVGGGNAAWLGGVIKGKGDWEWIGGDKVGESQRFAKEFAAGFVHLDPKGRLVARANDGSGGSLSPWVNAFICEWE